MKTFTLTRIQNFWNKEWILKCVSVLLAILLWYFVGGEEKVDKSVMIPVEVINLPRDLVISNQFKKEIEVTVNGPRTLINELAKTATSLQVDLSDTEPGSKVVDITARSIDMPRGITVQRVQPSSIILSLEKLVQKKLDIKAIIWGKVAEGYQVQGVTVDPDSLSITGAQTQMAQVKKLETKMIDITDLKESVQLQVPLQLDPGIVELIGETSVTVDVKIGMIMVDRVVKDIPLHVVVDGIEQEIVPSTVTLNVRVPKLIIDGKRNVSDLFEVSTIGDIKDGVLQVKVMPKAGADFPLEIKSIVPSSVKLEKIVKPPTRESETPRLDTKGNIIDKQIPVIEKTKDKILM